MNNKKIQLTPASFTLIMYLLPEPTNAVSSRCLLNSQELSKNYPWRWTSLLGVVKRKKKYHFSVVTGPGHLRMLWLLIHIGRRSCHINCSTQVLNSCRCWDTVRALTATRRWQILANLPCLCRRKCNMLTLLRKVVK